MSIRTSGRTGNGKASRASRSNASAVQVDHEDQAGSSTWLHAQAQDDRDGLSNSGEFPCILMIKYDVS